MVSSKRSDSPALPARRSGRRERLPLAKQVEDLLDECRIVLTGLQVLFGFQLAVVFSQRFDQVLAKPQQELHLLAMALIAVAIGLIVTPAAYHRQVEPQEASDRFVLWSSWLLLAALPPFGIAVAIELYLVAQVVLDWAALWIAGAALLVFVALWLGLPRVALWHAHRHRTDR